MFNEGKTWQPIYTRNDVVVKGLNVTILMVNFVLCSNVICGVRDNDDNIVCNTCVCKTESDTETDISITASSLTTLPPKMLKQT